MMANEFVQGFGFGKGVVDDAFQSQRQNRLSELASQAYGSQGPQRDALVQQAVRVDPSSGMALGDQLQGREDKRKTRMAGAAKYLLSAFERGDQAAIQGAYRTVRPEFEALSNGAQLPDQVDDTIKPMLHQIIAAAGGGTTGSNVQSTYVNAQGQRVAIMRDGSQQVLGDANQSIRVLEQAGALPYGVVTSGGVAGQVVPLGGGQPAAPQGQQRAPGEVPFSIDPSLPPQVQASIRANESQWAQAPDMGSVQIGQPQQQGGPVRTPTAGEVAADQAQARADAEFRNYDRMTDRVAERAAAEATAKESAKIEAERSVANRERQAAFETFDAAMSELERAMGETVTGPVIGRLPALTADQQTADGTVAAMAPILKQLFRSAGEGVFTDKDQALLIQMLPTREDHPEARDNKVANVRRIVEAKLRAGQTAQSQPAQGRRLKFNPATGRIE